MTTRRIMMGAVLCVPMMSGCMGSEHEPDLGFRVAEDPWVPDPSYEGNGDLEVRDGDDDGVDVPDSIIWDISGGNVTRQTEPGVFSAELTVDGNEVHEVDLSGTGTGDPVCTAIVTDEPSGQTVALVDDASEVVLTVWKQHVFIGEVEGSPAANKASAAFSFKKDRIYLGPWTDGIVVASTSTEIDKADPMRRLLLGALVAGECASDGLP